MTCIEVYHMAAKYLAACRRERDDVSGQSESKTVKPADALAGTSGGTTTVSVKKSETRGFEDPLEHIISIINGISYELCALADDYCRQKGMVQGRFVLEKTTKSEDRFPLPERFAPAVSFYLASILCMPYDTAMAAALQARYEAAVEGIRRELTAVITPIKEVYPPLAM